MLNAENECIVSWVEGIPLASKAFGCQARARSGSAAIRNERATTQTNPFQANPEGRWRFGRFSALLAPHVPI